MRTALYRLASGFGLLATLLVATPQAQRAAAPVARAQTRTVATPQAAPAPATPQKAPVQAPSGWNNLLLRITRRKQEDEDDYFRLFRQSGKRRYNRRANRAALNNWSLTPERP